MRLSLSVTLPALAADQAAPAKKEMHKHHHKCHDEKKGECHHKHGMKNHHDKNMMKDGGNKSASPHADDWSHLNP